MPAAALPLSIAVHANQLDAVEEVCGPALGCAQTDVLGQLLLLVVFGLVTVFVLAAIQRVTAARSAVEEEQSRTATERDAFARFAREIESVDPSQSAYQLASSAGAVSTASVAGHRPTDGRLEAVREAYRETVMSMPHFDEEYGEPLALHLQEEFGQEVATAVADGDRLTPALKHVLVQRARDAARERERLMRRLDREADALEAAEEELRAVDTEIREAEGRPLMELGYRQLVDEWNRLGEVESRLSRLLARRQEGLQSRWRSSYSQRPGSLAEYLYGELDTSFPVLADGATLVDRVKAARSRVLGALTARA